MFFVRMLWARISESNYEVLYFVIFPIPLDKFLYPLFYRGRGLEANVFYQVIYISIGCRHVACLDRQEVLFRFFAEAIFKDLDEMHQLHRVVVADVVEFVGSIACRRVRSVA